MIKSNRILVTVAALTAAFFIALTPPASGVSYLKQSTAATVLVGPFVDAADGVTAETGITPGSQCDLIKGVTKSDLTLTASGGDNDFVHVANGYWSVELTTGNTDTLGPLTLTFTDSAVFVPVWKEYVVVTANVYDTMFSTDTFDVNVATIAANAITETAINDGAITNAKVADDVDVDVNTINGVAAGTALATDEEIADAVWDEAKSGHTGDGTFGGDALDADVWTDAKAGYLDEAISGIDDNPWDAVSRTLTGTINDFDELLTGLDDSADVADAVWDEAKAGHTSDGTFGGDALDADTWTDAKAGYLDEAISGIDDNPWDAATRTLTAIDEDTTTIDLDASYVGGVTTFDEDSTTIDVNATLIGGIAGTTQTFDALSLTLDDTATLVDAVWDEDVVAAHDTADTSGYILEILQGKLPTNYIMGSSVLTAKDDEIDDILTDTGTTLDAKLNTIDDYVDTEVAAILADTATIDTPGEIASAVWDALIASYDVSGSFGEVMNDQPTVSDVAGAVWDETSTGHTDAGKAGQQLWTDVDAILEDTGTTLDDLVDDLETRLTATRAGYLDNLNTLETAEDIATAVWATDRATPTADSYGWVMKTLLDVLAGRMKIDTAAYTLTFYDYDTDTEASQVFYLFDSAGAYSTTAVYERDKDALP